MGGGTVSPPTSTVFGYGLSPRGRGNPERLLGIERQGGSIPAWAGEPSTSLWAGSPYTVYPRVGGGTEVFALNPYPRVGLSPRGRGNLLGHGLFRRSNRSIPAWAGEPALTTSTRSRPSVYPRVGGGTAGRSASRRTIPGLSPRGRGNPRNRRLLRAGEGSIPAWAGEPVSDSKGGNPVEVYPRVGGGTVSQVVSEAVS